MNTKPGYKTTEFWLVLVFSIWSMFGGSVPAPWNVGIPMLAAGLYAIARGLAKVGVIKGTVGADLNKDSFVLPK